MTSTPTPAGQPAEHPADDNPAPKQTAEAPPAGDRPPFHEEEQPSGALAIVRETVVLVLLAVLLAVVFKTFLVQAFYIPSGSMEPTLEISDRVLVEKLSYRFGHVQDGDIVVFVHDEPGLTPTEPSNPVARFFTGLGQAIGIAPPSERDFIKRVVGVPGDRLDCRNERLYRNGRALSEPYLAPDTPTDCRAVTVPAGKLYVMGDNRTNSQDSRVFGPVDGSTVVGRAFVRIWPLTRLGVLHRS